MSVDKRTPLWREVRSHILQQIEEARDKLEQMHTSQELTMLQRGRLSAYREILALEDKKPEVVASTAVY